MPSAWLYRQKTSKYWWLGWRVGGAPHFRFTKQTDRKEAKKQLSKIQSMFAAHEAGMLDEVYHALSGKAVARVTLKAAVEQWLADPKQFPGTFRLIEFAFQRGEERLSKEEGPSRRVPGLKISLNLNAPKNPSKPLSDGRLFFI